jgi:hypothetical protein
MRNKCDRKSRADVDRDRRRAGKPIDADRKLTAKATGRYEEERAMTTHTGRVICNITISADGYSAGLNQTEERPFGDDGGDG